MQKIQNISNRIVEAFSVKSMIIAIVIFVLFMMFVLPAASSYSKSKSGSADSPDMSIVYSADDIYKMAEDFGREGRDSYIFMRFTFDLIWPFVYLFFIASLMANLLRGFSESSWLRRLVLLPFIGTILDFLENIFAAITIGRFPNKTPIIAELTPLWSFLKWMSLGISFACIVALIIFWVFKRITKEK